MTDELERSVELLERLLGDSHLRRRFRNDAATVLTEAGLPELAAGLGDGGRALMTLEMRESRSSLAGVMVAAAAEGVDLAQFAEHAAPALARDAGAAIHQLMQHPHQAAPKPAHEAVAPQPAKPSFAPPAETPTLAPPEPKAPSPANASLPNSQAPAPVAPAGSAQPEAASATQPAAIQTPSQGARWSPRRRVRGPAVRGWSSRGSQRPLTIITQARPTAPVTPEPADAGPVYPGDEATPSRSPPGWAPRGESWTAAGAAGDGGAHRIGAAQPVLRRSRLRRVLRDAGGHLGPGL